MIKINHLSDRIYNVMVERFKIGRDTSMKGWLLKLSGLWREADQAIHERECRRFVYSQLELVLADIILFCVALLMRLGVRNMENLLRRRLDDNDKANKLKK